MKRYIAVALALMFYASLLPWSAGAAPPNARFHNITSDNGAITGFSTISSNDLITKGPWVDVRAFGADNTGATDTYTELAAAIATLDNGSTLLIPKGTYLTSGELLISGKSDITIFAYGATLKFANAFTTSTNALSISYCNNVKIFGLMFDGNKANQTTEQSNALAVRHSDRVTVRYCKFVDVKYHAILVDQATKLLVDDCDFIDNYGATSNSDVYGSGPDGSDVATFSNCRFVRDTVTFDFSDPLTATQSFYVVGGDWRYINLSFDNTAWPYDFRYGTHTVIGSRMNNIMLAISQSYSDVKSFISDVIARNIQGSAASTGVNIYSGSSTIDKSYFSGKAGSNYAYGIIIGGGNVANVPLREIKISNTTIDNASSYGIYVYGTGNGVLIDKVTFRNGAGAVITETSTGNIVITDPVLDNVSVMSSDAGGTHRVIGHHASHKTVNSGTAAYDNVTTLAIAHGLSVTPTSIQVTPSANAGSIWVTSIGATNFTVNSDNAVVGASVYWKAEKY